jgi:cytochrome b561
MAWWRIDLGGQLLAFHRSLGVMIWTTTVLRILWRITGARSPEFPTSMTPMHQLGARLSEYALYAVLLIQPATGLAQTILRGHPFKLFVWSIPSLATRNLALTGLFSKIHEIGALAGLHAAAALVHHFILRDDVLQTMAPVFRRRVVRVAGLGRKLQQPARAVDIPHRLGR